VEHSDVIQGEATEEQSKSKAPIDISSGLYFSYALTCFRHNELKRVDDEVMR
jgi:hypothetical protein